MAHQVHLQLALCLALSFSALTSAYDPQPLKDFCVLDPLLGSCKSDAAVVAADFVYTGLAVAPTIAPGAAIAAQAVSVKEFPALNTMGISLTKVTIPPCGMNPPHVHPRGTELFHLLEGSVYVAFVDTNNKLFANVLKTGDTTVFPRGLVHVVYNAGKTRAVGLASFNSQNPGTTRVAQALFKSLDVNNQTLPAGLLATAFGVTPAIIQNLKMIVPNPPKAGTANTGCKIYT